MTIRSECCKSFLKSHGATYQGIKLKLIDRRLLLKKLITQGLEKLMMLSKRKLRSMCTQLTLPDTSDIAKDSMIKSVSDDMLDNCGDTANGMLAGIANEDELNS